MSRFGIRSSRRDVDARKGEILLQTITSLKNTLKVATSGYGTASVPTDYGTTGIKWELDITHGLGYKPIILFYYKHPTNDRWHRAISYSDINSGASWALYAGYSNTDVNTVKLFMYDGLLDPMPSTPTNVDYKYYIMVDPRKDAWYE